MTKQIPPGYKQTKVGIIPEDWEIVRLGDICAFYKGKGISKEDLSEEGTPCIRYGELYTTYNERIDNVISKTNVDINELFLSKSNDIIIPASGETAIDIATASCVLQDNIALSGDLNVIRTKENGIFLSYYLNVVAKHRIASIAQGVSVVHLYSSQLESLFLSLPPLKEQEKIAEILSTWDEAITKQEQLIEQKQIFKKCIMQQIFSQKIRFKDDNGNDYPAWQTKKLGDISKKCITKNRNEVINLVLTNSATNGIVSQVDYFDKDIANANNLSGYWVVNKYDFAYNPRISANAPVGPINCNYLDTGVMSPLYMIFKFSQGIVRFFEYYFKTNMWHEYMKSIANYGARNDRMNITSLGFFNMSMIYPSIEEQTKIANFLTSIDGEINKQTEILDQLKLQNQSLMQDLLTGQVRTFNFSKEIA